MSASTGGQRDNGGCFKGLGLGRMVRAKPQRRFCHPGEAPKAEGSPHACPCWWKLPGSQLAMHSTFPSLFPSCSCKRRRKIHKLCRLSPRFIPHPRPALLFITGLHGIEVSNQKVFLCVFLRDILNLFIFPKEPYITLSSRSICYHLPWSSLMLEAAWVVWWLRTRAVKPLDSNSGCTCCVMLGDLTSVFLTFFIVK